MSRRLVSTVKNLKENVLRKIVAKRNCPLLSASATVSVVISIWIYPLQYQLCVE